MHESRVTIHMAASLDGFIARKDGRVDWMETPDEFPDGESLDPAFVAAFLKTIDCYVMGSRTYETALSFETRGFGWAYGDKPVFVLTRRELPRTRETVQFHAGYDLKAAPSLASINEWNRRQRFGRAYLDGENDPILEMDVDLDDGGLSEALFIDNLEFWTSAMGGFEKHIGFAD